jgi:geranylgeranyl diphosphate synthase type I
MVQKKTAALYAAALAMGGILADGTEDVVDALWEFGIATGVAFQIRDDVLDLITPREVLGKDQGSDLVEGKMTLVMIHALKHGVRVDASRLTSERDMEEAIRTIQNAGSIVYAMDKAKEILRAGKSKIASIRDSEAKDELLHLADHMISRTY